MSITDELRAAMPVSYGHVDMEATRFDHLCDAIDAVHASLERENASLRVELDDALDGGIPMTDENMLAEGWIRLPKDADGEYVHIGDVMECIGLDSDEILTVRGVGNGMLFYIDGCDVKWTVARNKRHYHAPTVEDVLFSYGQACIRASNEAETDAAKQTMLARLREEYAAKLRLAEGEDV